MQGYTVVMQPGYEGEAFPHTAPSMLGQPYVSAQGQQLVIGKIPEILLPHPADIRLGKVAEIKRGEPTKAKEGEVCEIKAGEVIQNKVGEKTGIKVQQHYCNLGEVTVVISGPQPTK